MTEVTLNLAEQKLAQYLAKARNDACFGAKIPNQRLSPQSDLEINLEGIGSEIAFCKIMNVYPDFDTDSPKDFDAYTTSMGSVDVKATQYKNGRLLVRETKLGKEADAYALMIGTFPKYRFVGWVTADELFREENLTNTGYGMSYVMDQSQLRKPKSED